MLRVSNIIAHGHFYNCDEDEFFDGISVLIFAKWEISFFRRKSCTVQESANRKPPPKSSII